jgi:phosphoglycerol transferase MdoB-like AlkP superfamily enzyme
MRPIILAPCSLVVGGVSDEDLFNKTDEDLQRLHAAGQPFFRLVFSSSNHTPFEFPDDQISLYDAEKNTVNNAVKYADHALGEFIATARQRDYWKNTVVLIVADHDARVWGDELVPTLLSLMGIESDHPMIGRDLTQHPDDPGRAIMQFNDNYAWKTGSGGLWRSHSCRYGSIGNKSTTCPT